jgi:hypothetical protein
MRGGLSQIWSLMVRRLIEWDACKDVFEGNLIAVCSPSMREYSIKRNVIFDKLGQGEVNMTVDF